MKKGKTLVRSSLSGGRPYTRGLAACARMPRPYAARKSSIWSARTPTHPPRWPSKKVCVISRVSRCALETYASCVFRKPMGREFVPDGLRWLGAGLERHRQRGGGWPRYTRSKRGEGGRWSSERALPLAPFSLPFLLLFPSGALSRPRGRRGGRERAWRRGLVTRAGKKIGKRAAQSRTTTAHTLLWWYMPVRELDLPVANASQNFSSPCGCIRTKNLVTHPLLLGHQFLLEQTYI